MDDRAYALGMNSASNGFGVALAGPDGLVAQSSSRGIHHSERLLPEIDHMLGRAGVERSRLGVVATTIGPGSFTSVRIGLSTAKGLCMGLGLPLVGVSSLAATAALVPFSRWPVAVWLDARRSEVYAGVFDTTGSGLAPREVEADSVVRPEVWLQSHQGPFVFAGSGVRAYYDDIRSAYGPDAHFVPELHQEYSAAVAAMLGRERALAGDLRPVDAVAPVYLRRPDAVKPGVSSRKR